jgi:fibronectin type 3 domain-containing protein
MRIFLLRPFMLALHRMHHAKQSSSVEPSVEEMVAKSTLNQVTSTCVSATEELIDLIWERTMDATDDLSFAWSWWYNVFCK